jgi:hypothetical protein
MLLQMAKIGIEIIVIFQGYFYFLDIFTLTRTNLAHMTKMKHISFVCLKNSGSAWHDDVTNYNLL